MKRPQEETVLLWRTRRRVRGRPNEVRCTMEQLGEGCFELRMLSGHETLLFESFDDPEKLVSRAEQLRIEFKATA